MRKSVLFAVGAVVVGGTLTGAGTSVAYDAPPGQAHCDRLRPGGHEATVTCANNTDHPATAEVWIDCRPLSADRHISEVLYPGSRVDITIGCGSGWGEVKGRAASAH